MSSFNAFNLTNRLQNRFQQQDCEDLDLLHSKMMDDKRWKLTVLESEGKLDNALLNTDGA